MSNALTVTGSTLGSSGGGSAVHGHQRTFTLQDRSLPGLAPFAAREGNAMMDKRRALAASSAALGSTLRGLALDVQLLPCSGVLGPWGRVAVVVTAHADMPGDYVDKLCVQVS